ncbi:MAG: hypothetical protein RL385_3513, partial [Pseudomonadota bacterium]
RRVPGRLHGDETREDYPSDSDPLQ